MPTRRQSLTDVVAVGVGPTTTPFFAAPQYFPAAYVTSANLLRFNQSHVAGGATGQPRVPALVEEPCNLANKCCSRVGELFQTQAELIGHPGWEDPCPRKVFLQLSFSPRWKSSEFYFLVIFV